MGPEAERRQPASDIQPPRFGRRLAALRRSRGVSQRALARAAGLTPEHLSRVERGHRPPPRRPTVLRLAAALGLEPGGAVADLLAAAGYDSAATIALPVPSPDQSGPPPPATPTIGSGASTLVRAPSRPGVHDLPGAVFGPEAVAHAAVLLLRDAASRPAPAGDAVCLSLGKGAEALFAEAAVRDCWLAALRQLVASGRHFRHLWQLPDGHRWPPWVIAELTALLDWPARYQPAYVPCPTGAPWSPRDLLVVPGVGALVGLSAAPGTLDAALVARDPVVVAALADQFARLFARARPLVATHLVGWRGAAGNAARLRFTEAGTAAHEEAGDHLIVKDGLPNRFAPVAPWLRQDLGRHGVRGWTSEEADYRRGLLRCRERTGAAIAAEMRTWRHREICSMRGFDRFVAHGASSIDDFLLADLPPVARDDRAEGLLRCLGQLHRHPNYELALLDRDLEHLARPVWVVKGNRFFSLEVARPAAGGRRRDAMVVVTDERLVAGFRAHFDLLWNGLPPRSRDKAAVGAWLERRLDSLR